MDKPAIVRSMTSRLGEHNFGTHYLMTGYKPSPALKYPTFGATLAQVRSKVAGTLRRAVRDVNHEDANGTRSVPATFLPPHVAVPDFSGNVSGNRFLPGATRPFSIGGNPERPDFEVRALDFYRGLDLTRLDRRRKIVNAFDQFSGAKDASASLKSNPDLEQACNRIASPSAKGVFRLADEPESVRNRYARTGGGDSIGQSCLLA